MYGKWAKVIRGGTVRTAPHDEAAEVCRLRDVQTTVVFEKYNTNGAWAKVISEGREGWTRSYRIALDGVRADLKFGCEEWLDKPYGLHLVPREEHDTEAEDQEPVKVVYREVPAAEPPTEDGPAREAEILNAGVLGFSDVPGAPGPRGFLEPGGGTLQLLDRWLTSRERIAALKAASAKDRTPVSVARYNLATAAIRCATFGLAAYVALTVALRLLG